VIQITVKIKLPSTVGVVPLLLMVIGVLLFLNGCASQHTVTYIPHKEPRQQVESDRSVSHDSREDVTEALKEYFVSWKGTRYRYGGLSHNGVDCSGFVLLTYQDVFGKDLPRTVREQVKEGTKISKASLQAGDLLFFKTGRFQKHVGIYLEDDLFIHASQSKGVIISSLNNVYWKKKFWQAHRLHPEDDTKKLSFEMAQQTVPADS
jgi:probable lipoprotein NlpC